MGEFTVNFVAQDKSVRVKAGTDLLSAAAKAGIVLTAACGGEGLCGKCKVIIAGGNAKAEPSRLLTEEEKGRGVVLACETLVEGDLKVIVPPESIESREHISHDAEEFTKGVVLDEERRFPRMPLIRKVDLDLSRPSADDATDDLDRVYEALGMKIENPLVSTKLANIKHLTEVLRENDFKVTAVTAYKDGGVELTAVEPRGEKEANAGLAFDVGTTTVVGQLVDLDSGDVLGSRIAFNRQAAYGSDIITRIVYGSEPEGLQKLSEAVTENINEMIEDLCSSAKVNKGDIYGIVLAGNMTMMHLLLKIDPSGIRKAPYVPATVVFPPMSTAELGLEINPKGIAAFLPGVGSYIGGDVVAGLLACGLYKNEELSLLADLGTNGEIVLGNKEWMMGAAASAGPAFEGSGMSCGMKAVKGAIEKVTIDGRLNVKAGTIGNEKARGICGSGYIDLLCQMLKHRIIEKDGKINTSLRSPRIRKNENNHEFVVVPGDESGTGRDIVVTEDDIENLKRAKGAIYSAIVSLLRKVGKDISEVKKIYIAGGFGNYLNIENAVRIGLMPDTKRSVFEFIGNSSLAGARMSLLSHEAFEMTNAIYRNVTYVDLSSEPAYMDEYIAALFFPHTDSRRFPSVR